MKTKLSYLHQFIQIFLSFSHEEENAFFLENVKEDLLLPFVFQNTLAI